MNGVHDMGGMHGFGPVIREAHEPTYHAPWEGHVYAMMRFAVGNDAFNLDEFRYGIEQMDPAHYLQSTYYERWLATVEYNLLLKQVVTAEELDARIELLRRDPEATVPSATHGAPWGIRSMYADTPPVALQPRFALGDVVITRTMHPRTHTRLPRYTRGKRGVINIVHGPEIFPDSNAHGRGKAPQVAYNVRFDARELWGDAAEPNQTVSIDLWESYLEPAPTEAPTP